MTRSMMHGTFWEPGNAEIDADYLLELLMQSIYNRNIAVVRTDRKKSPAYCLTQ